MQNTHLQPSGAPGLRVRRANRRPPAPARDFVLYWMIAARRHSWSFALDHAVAWCRALGKPLLIFEPLRADYPWASDRLHRFVLDGLRDNERAFGRTPATYYPYVEPRLGAARGLLAALARRACLVITDEFPCFFLPPMVRAAAAALDVALDVIDGNGMLPLAAGDREFSAAVHFRRYAQRVLPEHLREFPTPDPFSRWQGTARIDLPPSILRRWPRASPHLLAGDASALAALPIDHSIPESSMRGGSAAGRAALRRFVDRRLATYARDRGEPSADATSRLSPYLHFGHLSVHEVFDAVMRHEDWSPDRLSDRATAQRRGWWGVREGADAFLDQLVVWRELAYHTCARRPRDYARYRSLPAWVRATLDHHRRDPRPHIYTRRELEDACTHDPIWNAAQRQLREEGWFHNYMRMLWGKKILEWSSSPRAALATMIAIMDRWSLDGRDPCSYAGYAWVLGRYDRPWGERPIFGTVRSMSSQRAASKLDLEGYLARHGGHR